MPRVPSPMRERIQLRGDAMMDTIFLHAVSSDGSPIPSPDVPAVDDPKHAENLAAFRQYAAFRWIGNPTKRLFVPPSDGKVERIGVLPNDETMIVTNVNLVLRSTGPTKLTAGKIRTVLDNVTIGLMVNNTYEFMVPASSKTPGMETWNVMGGDGMVQGGAQIAARMGFYVTALIGRRAKEILEDTPGAHLLVQLEGTYVRDAIGPVEKSEVH